MSTLTVTKSYSNTAALTEAMLDSFKSSIETFVNSTKLTADNISDGSVVAGKLGNNSVTTAKIAANAVTNAKLDDLGEQVTSSSVAFSTAEAVTPALVTNMSTSLTTSGRPVMLQIISDGSAGYFVVSSTSTLPLYALAYFYRDSTLVGKHQLAFSPTTGTNVAAFIPSGSLTHVDVVSSGTYTYSVKLLAAGGNSGAGLGYSKLVAFEL